MYLTYSYTTIFFYKILALTVENHIDLSRGQLYILLIVAPLVISRTPTNTLGRMAWYYWGLRWVLSTYQFQPVANHCLSHLIAQYGREGGKEGRREGRWDRVTEGRKGSSSHQEILDSRVISRRLTHINIITTVTRRSDIGICIICYLIRIRM